LQCDNDKVRLQSSDFVRDTGQPENLLGIGGAETFIKQGTFSVFLGSMINMNCNHKSSFCTAFVGKFLNRWW